MTTKIHIVDCGGELQIIQDHQLKNGCIKVRHYEGDDDYYDENVVVEIKETFLVMTQGNFIRNYEDSSKLNACTMSGGFGQVNRLAYSYSVVIMTYTFFRVQRYTSDCIYTDAGIRPTQFDMYSYHVNEPEQKYTESRLGYEVFDSLNLHKILSKYLPKAVVRDSVIDNILNETK